METDFIGYSFPPKKLIIGHVSPPIFFIFGANYLVPNPNLKTDNMNLTYEPT